jgi:Family of unknown function (DUF6400)
MEFVHDLTLDQARLRAAVLAALADDWDPVRVLAEQQRAIKLLYSGLDNEQQRIYDDLVSAGVLAKGGADRVAD